MSNTYDVYIQKWKNADGTISSAPEKLMFSIPQNNPEGFPMISPTVKCGEDSADSLDFSMNVGMEYYDLLIPLKTIIRVEYYGNTIFYGRVLTINASTVMQTRSVHCEGAFGFFNDSYYPATADTKREEISWSTYFDRILSNHNNYIHGDDVKKFNRGTVDFTPSTQNKKFEPTGWTQTSSMLSSLKDELGGHMLSRYSGGYNYIDWYKYHKRDLGNGNRPVVQVGENVIDISSNMDVGNLFTRVIPVGKSDNDGSKITINGYAYTDRNGVRHTHGTDYMSVSLIRSLYSDAELSNDYHTPQDFDDSESKYGIIYKTIQFSDAATPEQLWNECAKWIKESFYGAVTSFEIRAIDMHIQNTSLPLILLGDCVDIYYKIMENGQMVTKYRKMIAKSIKYDLFNPSNNSYSFGIPSDLLKTSKSQSSSKKKKTASESMSAPIIDTDMPDKELTFSKVADIIRKDPDVVNGYGGDAAADSFIANGKLSGSVNVYDADIHYDPVGHPEICFTGQIIGKITISGKVPKWIAVNNAHGLFAYIDNVEASVTGAAQVVAAVVAGNANVARPTTHWYIKEAGYTYTDFSVWQSVAAETSVKAVIAATQGLAVYAGGYSIIDLVGKTINAATVNSIEGVITTANKMALDVQNSIISLLPGQKNSSGNEIVSAQIGGNDGGKMSVFDEWGNKIMEAAGKDQKMSFYERIGSSMSGKVSASIQAASGTVASIISKIGKDGSGTDALTSIIQNGSNGSMTLYNLNGGSTGDVKKKAMEMLSGTGLANWFNTGTDSSTEQKTVEINAAGTSGEGKVNVGNKGNGDWRVQLNNKVTYTDENGDTYTLPGFVTAEDFSMLQSIPSFKTKYAIIDKLWADQGTFNNLTVNNNGWIRNLDSDTIKASTRISTSQLRTWEVLVSGTKNPRISCSGNIYAGGTFYLRGDGEGNDVNLGRCYNSVELNSSTGVFTFYRANGADPTTFSMADTTFYKNAVSASFDSDHQMFITGPGSDDKVSADTLDPGQSKNYYPTFKKKGSGYQYGSLVKVTARSLNLQAKSVAPTTSAQTITADSGRDGLSSVNVSAATKQAKTVSASTSSNVEVTADAGYYGLSKVTVNQFKVQSKTVTPGKDAKVILPDSGYSALSNVSLNGDDDLVAGNIKSGVSIFGVTGTYSGGSASVTDISMWNGSSDRISGNRTISSTLTLTAWCKVDGTWVSGDVAYITPSGGSSYTSLGSWYYTKYQLPSGLWHHQFVLEQSGSSISGLSNNTSYKLYK